MKIETKFELKDLSKDQFESMEIFLDRNAGIARHDLIYGNEDQYGFTIVATSGAAAQLIKNQIDLMDKIASRKKEAKFMEDLIEVLKDFVLDSVAEGHHEEFSDHNDFLKSALETFININEE